MKSHMRRNIITRGGPSNSGRNPKDIILVVSHIEGVTIQEEREDRGR